MYRLERPSMALNDPRVSLGTPPNVRRRRFEMQTTWDIQANETRQHIISWVAEVARNATGGQLRNLVLNCHGLPGYLQLGEGFSREHIILLNPWRGLIRKIWLPNCQVARVPNEAMQAQLNQDFPGWGWGWGAGDGDGDGDRFCSEMAGVVQCHVIASTEIQCDNFRTIPRDMMTSFEGLVLSYGPNGRTPWSSRNRSTVTHSTGGCSIVPDWRRSANPFHRVQTA